MFLCLGGHVSVQVTEVMKAIKAIENKLADLDKRHLAIPMEVPTQNLQQALLQYSKYLVSLHTCKKKSVIFVCHIS